MSLRNLSANDLHTWGGAISAYVVMLQAAARSTGTIRVHRHYLSLLAGTFPRPWDVTTDDLRALLASRTWKPETRKSARTVYRGFYKWGFIKGLCDPDPTLGLETIRVPAGVARPTPESVLKRALLAADARTTTMLMLAAYGGLRCAEIARVHGQDVAGDVLLVHGKGGKTREVPLVPVLLERLQGLDGWAFPNGLGSHLSPGHVTRLLSAALPEGWTGHTLRHRCGTAAYDGTRDLLAVSRLLGHSRPETTQRYIRMPDDAVRAAVSAAGPPEVSLGGIA